jgi:phosphatidylserine decarboxylase
MLFSFLRWFWAATPFYAGAIFVTWFFRNPERKIPKENGLVVAPADGRIIKVEDVDGNNFLTGRFRKISIFMNIFDVHVNRMPYSGTVEGIQYHKGRFLSADLDKASEVNEKNTIIIRSEEGFRIVVIQIAGLIARRIACWIEPGMNVRRGERFGLIRFGSRVEVILPYETGIVVKPGDRVKAGETPIGWLK